MQEILLICPVHLLRCLTLKKRNIIKPFNPTTNLGNGYHYFVHLIDKETDAQRVKLRQLAGGETGMQKSLPLGLALKSQIRWDFKAPSCDSKASQGRTAGRSPGRREAERRGLLVRSAEVGSHWPVRGGGGRQAGAARWLLPRV